HRYVVASHDYLDAHGTPSTPGELVDHACLRFHFGGDQRAWAFADAHGTTKVLVAGCLKSNHSEVLRDAALDGAGIALLPDDGTDMNALIEHADRAMYEVKRTRSKRTAHA
ncbi:hypothetical protein C3E98_033435, partial [Pseudomonas sp. MWU13-2625]